MSDDKSLKAFRRAFDERSLAQTIAESARLEGGHVVIPRGWKVGEPQPDAHGWRVSAEGAIAGRSLTCEGLGSSIEEAMVELALRIEALELAERKRQAGETAPSSGTPGHLPVMRVEIVDPEAEPPHDPETNT